MLTLPDLDDRAFEGLVNEAKKLIGFYDPSWTDHNLHDPGVTLAELFCWLIEAQEYYLNSIGDRNYLKYLKLMSAMPKGAQGARSQVSLALPAGDKKPVEFAKGIRAMAGETVFETEAPLWAHPLKLKGSVAAAAGRKIEYAERIGANGAYPLGGDPAPGSAFTLLFSANGAPYELPADKPVSLYFEFEKRPGARGAIENAPGDLIWEYYSPAAKGWRPLSVALDGTSGLRQSGRVALLAPPAPASKGADAEKPAADFAMRVRAARELAAAAAKLRSVAVNAVPVRQKKTICGLQELWWQGVGTKAQVAEYTHLERNKTYFMQYRRPEGYWCDFARTMYSISFKQDATATVTIRNKTIPDTDGRGVKLRLVAFYKRLPVYGGTGYPCQSVKLPFPSVSRDGFHVEVRERVAAPGKVTYEWFDWELVDDFDASGPSDRHYTLDCAEGRICFGDGLKGAVPKHIKQFPKNIRVLSCSLCEGVGGNLAEGAIDRLDEDLPRKDASVRNFTRASGGRNPESIPAAIGRMLGEMQETAAVTAEDYEKLALGAPGAEVARAKAIPLYAPGENGDPAEPRAASVCVVAAAYDREPSGRFLEIIEEHLEPMRLLATRLRVIAPDYVGVSVEASVRYRAGYAHDERAISDALDAFLSPVGDGKGYEGWPFGRTVYKSEVYRAIKKVEGVDFVGGIALKATGSGVRNYVNGNVELSPISLVYGAQHHIEII